MRSSLLLLCTLLLSSLSFTYSQTAIQTSFESSDGYNAGNINGQNGWSVTSGDVAVSNAAAKTGTQSVKFSAGNTALLAKYTAYSGTVTGLRNEVYADLRIKPVAFTTKGLTINGDDLFGGSTKRIFMIEFTTDNKIKVYNGSSGSNAGTWTANQWIRISVKADFSTEKYNVAFDGVVAGTDFAFRETYAPTTSGSREAGVKEFHSLRFNHSSDSQTATSEAYIDDIYVGTNPIADVSFGASSTARTITVTQPDYGTISLSPAKSTYNLGDEVTATLTLPSGYTNLGWTGSLSGTELSKNFTVTGNMTIGANTGIDSNNPPPKYTITINPPENAQITLSPTSADNTYYKETKVTATITYEPCYQFNGWTGNLSGTEISKTFTVTSDMTIGAQIVENTTPSVTRTVTSVTEFKNALNAMNPGDIIEVADGTYNLSSVKITRSGCQKRPIIIRAQHQGQAIFNGSTAFVLESIQYVTLQGFSFQSENIGTGIKLQNSSYTRITGNNFAIKENSSCNWVYIGDTFGSTEPLKSGHNLIDHNVFDGKTQPGKYIVLDGNINQQSQYDTIRYNLFKNNGPRVANEKESIRIGVSALSKSSGFTVVEYNLFQDCDGDPEIVSVKSCDNMVRYNTFQRCLGTVCLRQGERSVVEGNYFFGEGKTAIFTDEDSGSSSTIGCGGVRVYGRGHKVINNYFEGLTGDRWDAACTITNGDVTNSSTSLSDHYLPEDLVFAFNTLVNNKSNVEIGFDNGGKYSKYPINCQIANNIVVANANPIIKSYSTSALAGVSFSNNIMYPTRTASIGISATSSQVINTDPKLIHPACSGSDCALTTAARIFRLSENSPAIDAATGDFNFVTLDNEAQSRTGLKDIGATEYKSSTTITTGALSDENVGPNAVAFTYSYNSSSTLPVKLTGFQAIVQGNQVQLRWNTASEINVKQFDVEWQTADGLFKPIVTVMASGSRQYTAQHTNPLAGWNYYRLKITDNDGSFDYSPVAAAKILTSGAVVFPNPADQFVNINLDNVPANDTRLNLVNLQGVVVQTIPAAAVTQQTLTTTALPAGIYQLQVAEPGKKPVSYPVVVAH